MNTQHYKENIWGVPVTMTLWQDGPRFYVQAHLPGKDPQDPEYRYVADSAYAPFKAARERVKREVTLGLWPEALSDREGGIAHRIHLVHLKLGIDQFAPDPGSVDYEPDHEAYDEPHIDWEE